MPIIENSSGDGSLGDGLAKNKFGTDMLGLLTLTLTSESVYGSQFLHCKLLQNLEIVGLFIPQGL
jgi:hypothetical protein